jgi:hypothetical protein
MKQFLQAIVIEGRQGKQRRLEFRPGVNIITGSGSKGKSTVLHIIAYCLGADRCDIPLGKTRDYASWYFLVLNVGKGRVVIGRKAPAVGADLSDQAYYAYGSTPLVPEPAYSNHSIRSACHLLGEVIGLPRGEFRLQDESVYDELDVARQNIEMSDVLPLLLQRQDVIATRRLWASFTDRSAKDRPEIMRIALGIVDPNLLQLRAQQNKLAKRKRAFEADERQQRSEHQKSRGNLELIWQQAVLAGVVPPHPLGAVDQARAAVEALKSASDVELAKSLSAVDNKPLLDLDAKSGELRRELRRIHRDLQQIYRLRKFAREATAALQVESSRMRVVDVLGTQPHGGIACPLCGSGVGESTTAVLAEMQTELDAELEFTASIPPNLDDAESSLQKDHTRIRGELGTIERSLDALRKQEPALTFTKDRLDRERQIGALEGALRIMAPAPRRHPGRDAIEAEARDVEEKLASLRSVREAPDVMRLLSSNMTSIAREFNKINLGDGSLSFDANLSTLVREQGSRKEPLPILGGAEIHVMYHVAAFLGFHAYLSSPEARSFVPRFVVFDQPSQAYFPAESDQEGPDMEAVRSIYELIFRYSARVGERVQIIALDHADFSQNDEQFRAARLDWHGSDGLIQADDEPTT